ncbi:hypothetical protein ACN27G_27435 [Plantactinospora sp. WMMB334]
MSGTTPNRIRTLRRLASLSQRDLANRINEQAQPGRAADNRPPSN